MSRLLTYSILQQRKMPELLLHCKLDETSGTTIYDETNNNYDGTLVNSPTRTVGIEGNSVYFNGVNQYADFGNIINPGLDSLTFCIWLKGNILTPNQTFFAKGINRGAPGRYDVSLNANKVLVALYAATAAPSGDTFVISSIFTEIIDLNWHLIVYVIDRRNELRLYFDGALVASSDSIVQYRLESDASDGHLILSGHWNETNNGVALLVRYFIDSFFIYKGVLPDSSIQTMYDDYVPISTDLEAHFKLNETTGSITTSENGIYKVNLLNSPSWTTGIDGNCLQFNGTSQYGKAEATYIDLGILSWTMCCWFKTDDLSGFKTLFGKTIYGPGNGRFGLTALNNNLLASVVLDTEYYVTYPVTGYNDNNWHHIAMRVDRADKLTLFIDGQVKGTPLSISAKNNVMYYSPTYFFIGCWGNSIGSAPYANSYFKGLIDDIRLYKKSLTNTEIQSLYNEFI